ncbi:MetQ/NlpA family ABC transporter substrate-binding protein [Paenibacillus sediminis]|uniref:Lipoprotein n=1 Tax=Paenibacillus sediminis TaxID=664909 RepID=A0ABS4H614_9BACL|nr:MetQ/NlpA family ABC transporter substrate-binding protein [Paenibacillus sediminis]MBP1937931.1 D-methionine transport system substrate-binding protein [Paenibacillus sediminis]
MKKWLLSVLSLTLVLVLAACGADKAADKNEGASTSTNTTTATEPAQKTKLVVGASAEPHAKILEFIKPKLAAEGIDLEIKVFTDYVQPNTQLYEKQLDANYFQHKPYLDDQNKQRGMNLVPVVGVHVEPFGAYSKKYKKVDEIPNGATVAIPNDATNGGRALLLLQANGLIKLKPNAGIEATLKDITENPKNLKFIELDAAMLARQLDEVDLALINTNYALEAKLVPTKDALFIEGKDSPYTNLLVAREDNKDSDAIKKLAAALTSEDVKKFINDTYKGSVIPAF